MSCYGCDWAETFTFDRLAASGIVFDNHFMDTLSSTHPSSWTGANVFEGEGEGENDTEPTSSPLFLRLREASIPSQYIPPISSSESETPADEYFLLTLDKVGGQIDAFANEPNWLIWVDLPDLFPPWTVPEDILAKNFFDEHVPEPESGDEEFEEDNQSEDDESDEEDSVESGWEDEEPEKPLEPLLDPPMPEVDVEDSELLARLDFSYAAAVEHLDRSVGALIDALAEQDLLDEFVVVVTAQQSTAVGEHGFVGPSAPMLYEEVIHVPLIIRLPLAEQAGRRVPGFTQPIDLFPTLLELFGLTVEGGRGRSLVPLMQGERESIRDYAVAHTSNSHGQLWTIRTPSRGVLIRKEVDLEMPAVELYDKPDDRWEVNDLSQHFLEEVDAFTNFLPEFVKAIESEKSVELPPLPGLES